MIGIVDNALRAKISLLEFLEQRGWRPVRDNGREEVAGGLARLVRLARRPRARLSDVDSDIVALNYGHSKKIRHPRISIRCGVRRR